jgi:hypothetical protein
LLFRESSVTKAYEQFDDAGRMKPFFYHDRVVDVREEMVKFTLLTRGRSDCLTDRYSERREAADKLESCRRRSLAGRPLAGIAWHCRLDSFASSSISSYCNVEQKRPTASRGRQDRKLNFIPAYQERSQWSFD